MRIVYYDEAGDDGYPQCSSPLFVLSAVYLYYLNWKACFEKIHAFRRQLKEEYGLPIKWEMHTRYFLGGKKPYAALRHDVDTRLEIIGAFCRLIADLDLKIINTAIVKPRIQKPDYPVLDRALTYSIQRIENDLNPKVNPNEKFLIITDPGRIGSMRATTRRLQHINYIPSHFGPNPYAKPITTLIEDPLPKDSTESYFIQLADLVSYIVYHYVGHLTQAAAIPKRLQHFLTPTVVTDWLEVLKPSLNLSASPKDPYGIYCHP